MTLVKRVRVVCDSCFNMDTYCDGISELDARKLATKIGWTSTEEGDVCPSCLGTTKDYWVREPF